MCQEMDWFANFRLEILDFTMFEELFVFFIILVSSVIASRLLLRHDLGPFSNIVLALTYIGIWVHEISHFLASLAVGIVPKGIKVRYRSERTGEVHPHGWVAFSGKNTKMSFLQTLIICLAPLFVSTWLIYLSLSAFLSPEFSPFLRIFSACFCVSLFLGASPSSWDFKLIPISFKSDSRHSLYQIFLVSLSFLSTFILINFFAIVFEIYFFYYLIVIAFYISCKYGFKLMDKIVRKLSRENKKRNNLPKLKYKAFTRRRIKPPSAKELGIQESPW
ncbi:MAG: hypothetical protein ACTSRI_15115 [Promethearchaeota archaeon]